MSKHLDMVTEGVCPNCGGETYREEVDVGVGVIYGPYGCPCGWSEWEEYDQLIGNGGSQPDGSYQSPQGMVYPAENPILKLVNKLESKL